MPNDADSPTTGPPVDPLDDLLRSAQWPDDASDPLDRLLRMAQWPEPTAGRPDMRRRTWATFALAAAAVLLVALGLWSMRGSWDKSSDGVATTAAHNATPQSPASGAGEARHNPGPTAAQQARPEAAISRVTVAPINPPDLRRAIPPGGLRLRMVLARSKTRALSENEKLLDRILAQRIAEPAGDFERLIQPLLAGRREFERCLLERVHTFAGERESAAIELLGGIGSEASVPFLLQSSLKPSLHARAVRALLRIADAGTLSRLALREEDPALRREMTAALRARGDKQKLFFVLAVQGELSCPESGSDFWQPAESL